MYSEDTKEILKRHEELRETRALEEGTWRELALLMRPDERDFSQGEKSQSRDENDIFDSTPLYAVENFVGGLYGQAVNPANRWFELGVLEDPDLAKWGPVRAYLWQTTNVLYGSLAPGVSAFYATVAQACFANVGVFGFGPTYQEEWRGKNLMIDQAIPVGETFFDRDAAGNINEFHREFRLTGRQLKGRFGEEYTAGCQEEREYTTIHRVCENKEFNPNKLGPAGMPWSSFYVSPDLKDFRREGGYFEFPYHIPMWSPRSSSPYPTGPGHNSRADATMLQEMERTHLVAAQFQAEPVLLAKDKSVLSVADIEPNNILYGTISEAGKQYVQSLDRRSNVQLQMAQSEQRRNAIRTAFYFSIMQVVQRPQMTATEFLGYQEEALKLMAPNLARIQHGGLSPMIARRFRILERSGQMPEPPQELARYHLTPQYVSPLAKVQQLNEGRGILQGQQAVEQMALTDPTVRDWFNGDGAAPRVLRAFTSAPDVIRDPREVEAMRQARAQAMQQQRQLEQAGQAVEIAAEASHAAQASSLAGERGIRQVA
jgi:hypothetical protein